MIKTVDVVKSDAGFDVPKKEYDFIRSLIPEVTLQEIEFLPSPMEYLELPTDLPFTLVIMSWKLGIADILGWKREERAMKRLSTLRLFIPERLKPVGSLYWDTTSKRLIERLFPLLERTDFRDYVYTITKYRERPKSTFRVTSEKLSKKLVLSPEWTREQLKTLSTFYPVPTELILDTNNGG